MTDTQNEVFKTPVNKIRLFEHGAPGSQNLKLTRKYYTEDMPDGRVKHIVQNITDPDIVPYIIYLMVLVTVQTDKGFRQY